VPGATTIGHTVKRSVKRGEPRGPIAQRARQWPLTHRARGHYRGTMKKSIKRGHLHLTTEAVRTLTHTQLDAVAGGAFSWKAGTGCSAQACSGGSCVACTK
jgi:hypothetical protein